MLQIRRHCGPVLSNEIPVHQFQVRDQIDIIILYSTHLEFVGIHPLHDFLSCFPQASLNGNRVIECRIDIINRLYCVRDNTRLASVPAYVKIEGLAQAGFRRKNLP